jgi:phospholipid/cholesterol/gamma-HCH transport system permease protein
LQHASNDSAAPVEVPAAGAARQEAAARCDLELDPGDAQGARLRLAGDWRLRAPRPSAEAVGEALAAHAGVRRIAFETRDLARWDSGLLIFLIGLSRLQATRGVAVEPSGLPPGVQRLLELAAATSERPGTTGPGGRAPILARIGDAALRRADAALDAVGFLGETTLGLGRLLRGRKSFRGRDLWLMMQQAGAEALPIVSLISFLVGVILAFLGSIQLAQFGAEIYVANLVGIAMAREIGALMAAIIVAGRTGAAFAAELGTMQVNEEIDALRTLGLSPVDFLVLPRMLALVLMLPLLCLYADFVGILGGAAVSVAILDVTMTQYVEQTRAAVHVGDFAAGLIKSAVFGVLVAFAGCLRGMQCGRSSAAVGTATTQAVVTAIVLIVVSQAVLTVLFNVLGI